ncbi:MAG TPA: hypothetical protein DCE41_31820 [Cytophagales bacterium]|nr:hypothetical protein [Cytophagales bacterium]HAA20228.1 hypothetical protein [Cytophagales bacterium]HAP61988.1 hypothetical protein [Cytophagales bacterium]
MKVFISHSEQDDYVAGTIREKILAIGAEVFLNNHEMEFGDLITDSVKSNLADADEVIILVSKASISSTWISYEIGQAEAHSKRVIPILHGAEKNEVHEVLQNRHRLDISELDRYLNQLRKRMGKTETKPASSTDMPSPKAKEEEPPTHGLQIGTSIRLPLSRPAEAIRKGENIGWTQGMDPYLNRTAQVIEVAEDGSVRLSVDRGRYWFAAEWLEIL